MSKTKLVFFLIFISIMITACQTVTQKIDEKTLQEEKELSKWLNKPELELKIVYGQPDKTEFLETRNRYYIYSSKKYNITCVRKFEVNPNNMVIGFTSKNCF